MLEVIFEVMARSCHVGMPRLVGLSHPLSVPGDLFSLEGDLPLSLPDCGPVVFIMRIVEALISQFAS